MPQILTPGDVLGKNERILVYGEPKSGKTFLGGTMPDPIYWMIIGDRNEMKTLYAPAFREKHPGKVFIFDEALEEYGPRGEIGDAPVGMDRVGDLLEEAFVQRQAGTIPWFRSVVLENATTLQEFQMFKAMTAGYEISRNKEKTMLRRYREFGMMIPADSDYGGAQSLMDKIVNWMKSLDAHIMMIAHERVDMTVDRETRKETIHKIRPQFIGQQRRSIPRAFDNVWRTFQEGAGSRGSLYNVRTAGTETILAGSRVGGVLDDVVRNMNVEDAIEQMQEYARRIMAEPTDGKERKRK